MPRTKSQGIRPAIAFGQLRPSQAKVGQTVTDTVVIRSHLDSQEVGNLARWDGRAQVLAQQLQYQKVAGPDSGDLVQRRVRQFGPHQFSLDVLEPIPQVLLQ